MYLRTFFFVTVFVTIISILSSTFAMSHKFCYVVFLFATKKFSNFPF